MIEFFNSRDRSCVDPLLSCGCEVAGESHPSKMDLDEDLQSSRPLAEALNLSISDICFDSICGDDTFNSTDYCFDLLQEDNFMSSTNAESEHICDELRHFGFDKYKSNDFSENLLDFSHDETKTNSDFLLKDSFVESKLTENNFCNKEIHSYCFNSVDHVNLESIEPSVREFDRNFVDKYANDDFSFDDNVSLLFGDDISNSSLNPDLGNQSSDIDCSFLSFLQDGCWEDTFSELNDNDHDKDFEDNNCESNFLFKEFSSVKLRSCASTVKNFPEVSSQISNLHLSQVQNSSNDYQYNLFHEPNFEKHCLCSYLVVKSDHTYCKVNEKQSSFICKLHDNNSQSFFNSDQLIISDSLSSIPKGKQRKENEHHAQPNYLQGKLIQNCQESENESPSVTSLHTCLDSLMFDKHATNQLPSNNTVRPLSLNSKIVGNNQNTILPLHQDCGSNESEEAQSLFPAVEILLQTLKNPNQILDISGYQHESDDYYEIDVILDDDKYHGLYADEHSSKIFGTGKEDHQFLENSKEIENSSIVTKEIENRITNEIKKKERQYNILLNNQCSNHYSKENQSSNAISDRIHRSALPHILFPDLQNHMNDDNSSVTKTEEQGDQVLEIQILSDDCKINDAVPRNSDVVILSDISDFSTNKEKRSRYNHNNREKQNQKTVLRLKRKEKADEATVNNLNNIFRSGNDKKKFSDLNQSVKTATAIGPTRFISLLPQKYVSTHQNHPKADSLIISESKEHEKQYLELQIALHDNDNNDNNDQQNRLLKNSDLAILDQSNSVWKSDKGSIYNYNMEKGKIVNTCNEKNRRAFDTAAINLSHIVRPTKERMKPCGIKSKIMKTTETGATKQVSLSPQIFISNQQNYLNKGESTVSVYDDQISKLQHVLTDDCKQNDSLPKTSELVALDLSYFAMQRDKGLTNDYNIMEKRKRKVIKKQNRSGAAKEFTVNDITIIGNPENVKNKSTVLRSKSMKMSRVISAAMQGSVLPQKFLSNHQNDLNNVISTVPESDNDNDDGDKDDQFPKLQIVLGNECEQNDRLPKSYDALYVDDESNTSFTNNKSSKSDYKNMEKNNSIVIEKQKRNEKEIKCSFNKTDVIDKPKKDKNKSSGLGRKHLKTATVLFATTQGSVLPQKFLLNQQNYLNNAISTELECDDDDDKGDQFPKLKIVLDDYEQNNNQLKKSDVVYIDDKSSSLLDNDKSSTDEHKIVEKSDNKVMKRQKGNGKIMETVFDKISFIDRPEKNQNNSSELENRYLKTATVLFATTQVSVLPHKFITHQQKYLNDGNSAIPDCDDDPNDELKIVLDDVCDQNDSPLKHSDLVSLGEKSSTLSKKDKGSTNHYNKIKKQKRKTAVSHKRKAKPKEASDNNVNNSLRSADEKMEFMGFKSNVMKPSLSNKRVCRPITSYKPLLKKEKNSQLMCLLIDKAMFHKDMSFENNMKEMIKTVTDFNSKNEPLRSLEQVALKSKNKPQRRIKQTNKGLKNYIDAQKVEKIDFLKAITCTRKVSINDNRKNILAINARKEQQSFEHKFVPQVSQTHGVIENSTHEILKGVEDNADAKCSCPRIDIGGKNNFKSVRIRDILNKNVRQVAKSFNLLEEKSENDKYQEWKMDLKLLKQRKEDRLKRERKQVY